jgi:hypothetical protein
MAENMFQDQGLATVWDDHLSYILTPALSAYETERLTGEIFNWRDPYFSKVYVAHCNIGQHVV